MATELEKGGMDRQALVQLEKAKELNLDGAVPDHTARLLASLAILESRALRRLGRHREALVRLTKCLKSLEENQKWIFQSVPGEPAQLISQLKQEEALCKAASTR